MIRQVVSFYRDILMVIYAENELSKPSSNFWMRLLTFHFMLIFLTKACMYLSNNEKKSKTKSLGEGKTLNFKPRALVSKTRQSNIAFNFVLTTSAVTQMPNCIKGESSWHRSLGAGL